MRPVQANDPKPGLVTEAAKALMVNFQRGFTPMPKSAGGKQRQGTTKHTRITSRARGIIVPCTMQKRSFDSREECIAFFLARKADPTCRDVVKGSEGDHLYVAWNGKAA